MNCITNNINSTGFQAKLDISNINGSTKRWKNIADIVEKITPESQNITIKGYGSLKSGLSLDLIMDKVVLKDCCISEWGTKKLAELTELEVGYKLKTILNLMKEHINIEKKAVEEFNKNPQTQHNKNFTEHFRQSVVAELNATTQEALKNDSLLAKSLYI